MELISPLEIAVMAMSLPAEKHASRAMLLELTKREGAHFEWYPDKGQIRVVRDRKPQTKKKGPRTKKQQRREVDRRLKL